MSRLADALRTVWLGEFTALTAADRAAICSDFASAAITAVEHQRRIYIGNLQSYADSLRVVPDFTTADVRDFIRTPWTSAGSYPLYAITDDGAALCASCCRSEWRNIVDSMRTDCSDGWRVTAIDVNYESDIDCDHCGDMIPAAYLDDDERAAKRRGCDQCQELMIQGVRCHETGCPNAGCAS